MSNLALLEMKGAKEKFDREARRLKRVSARKVQSEVGKALRVTTKPMRVAVKERALADLPKSGGLNKWAAKTPIVSIKYNGPVTMAKVVLKKTGHDMRSLDRGRTRHPVFAKGSDRKKWRWVNQSTTPGFFTETVRVMGPAAIKEAEIAVRTAVALTMKETP